MKVQSPMKYVFSIVSLLLVLPLGCSYAQEAYDDIIMTVQGREDRADYLGWGLLTLPDANRDGYTDFAVSAFGRQKVLIYYGGPGILDDTEDAMLTGSGTLAGGDFNGDGLMDIAVQRHGRRIDSLTGEDLNLFIADSVYIYFAKDVDGCIYEDSPDMRLGIHEHWSTATQFGRYMKTGDFNGDGYTDLVTSAPFYYDPDSVTCKGGIVLVYLGAPDTPLSERYEIYPTDGCDVDFGFIVSLADVNGDGIDDIIAGVQKRKDMTPGSERPSKEVFLGHYGIKENEIQSVQVLDGLTLTTFTRGFIPPYPVMDINNDDHADFLFPEDRDIAVFHGSDSGFTTNERRIIRNPDPERLGWFQGSIHHIGDWNTDGYDDYAVRFNRWLLSYIVIYAGGPLGIRDTPMAYTFMRNDKQEYGRIVVSGDYNADGLCDYIASRPYDYDHSQEPLQRGVFHIVSGTDEISVGVAELENTYNNVFVYPVPTTNIVNIRNDDDLKLISAIELFDANGRLLFEKSQPNTFANGAYSFNLRMYASKPGLYVLRIHSGNEVLVKKVILLD